MAVTAAGFSFQQNGISDEMILAEAKTNTDINCDDWEVGSLPYIIFGSILKTCGFNFFNVIFIRELRLFLSCSKYFGVLRKLSMLSISKSFLYKQYVFSSR